jgi:hypothetical protein
MRLGACGPSLSCGSATNARFLPSFRYVFGRAAVALLVRSAPCMAVIDCDPFPHSQHELQAIKTQQVFSISVLGKRSRGDHHDGVNHDHDVYHDV